jgi:CubicO group peptidase (beta-lactamase class C family)
MKGVYEGKRVVSEKWIREATAPSLSCGYRFGGMSYGFLFWIVDPNRGIYAAIGDGGNLIYVNPGAQAVIAVASSFKPAIYDRVAFVEQNVLPLLAGSCEYHQQGS